MAAVESFVDLQKHLQSHHGQELLALRREVERSATGAARGADTTGAAGSLGSPPKIRVRSLATAHGTTEVTYVHADCTSYGSFADHARVRCIQLSVTGIHEATGDLFSTDHTEAKAWVLGVYPEEWHEFIFDVAVSPHSRRPSRFFPVLVESDTRHALVPPGDFQWDRVLLRDRKAGPPVVERLDIG